MFLKYCILILIGIIIFLLLNKNNIEGWTLTSSSGWLPNFLTMPDCRYLTPVKKITDTRKKYLNWDECQATECSKSIETMNPSCIQSCVFNDLATHESPEDSKKNDTFLETIRNTTWRQHGNPYPEQVDQYFDCWKQTKQSGALMEIYTNEGRAERPRRVHDIIRLENMKNVRNADTGALISGRNARKRNLLSTNIYNCPECIVPKCTRNCDDSLNIRERHKKIEAIITGLEYWDNMHDLNSFDSIEFPNELFDQVNSYNCRNIMNGLDRTIYKNEVGDDIYFNATENPQSEDIINEGAWGELTIEQKEQTCWNYSGCLYPDISPRERKMALDAGTPSDGDDFCLNNDQIKSDHWTRCIYMKQFDMCMSPGKEFSNQHSFKISTCDSRILGEKFLWTVGGIVIEILIKLSSLVEPEVTRPLLFQSGVISGGVVGIAALLQLQDAYTYNHAHIINLEVPDLEEQVNIITREDVSPENQNIKGLIEEREAIQTKINSIDPSGNVLNQELIDKKQEFKSANDTFLAKLKNPAPEDTQYDLEALFQDKEVKYQSYVETHNQVLRDDSLSDRLNSLNNQLNGAILFKNDSSYIERNLHGLHGLNPYGFNLSNFNRFIPENKQDSVLPSLLGSEVALTTDQRKPNIDDNDMNQLHLSEVLANIENTLMPDVSNVLPYSYNNVTPTPIMTVNSDYLYMGPDNSLIRDNSNAISSMNSDKRDMIETSLELDENENPKNFDDTFHKQIGKYFQSIYLFIPSIPNFNLITFGDIINIINGFMDAISLENMVNMITRDNCFRAGNFFVIYIINHRFSYISQFLKASSSAQHNIVLQFVRQGISILMTLLGSALAVIAGSQIHGWMQSYIRSPVQWILRLAGIDEFTFMKLLFLIGYFTIDTVHLMPYNPADGNIPNYLLTNYIPSIVIGAPLIAAYRVFDDYWDYYINTQLKYFRPQGGSSTISYKATPATEADLRDFDQKWGTNYHAYYRTDLIRDDNSQPLGVTEATEKQNEFKKAWKKYENSPAIWPDHTDYRSGLIGRNDNLNFVTKYYFMSGKAMLLLIPDLQREGGSGGNRGGYGDVVDGLTGHKDDRGGIKMANTREFVDQSVIEESNRQRLGYYLNINGKLREPDGRVTTAHGAQRGFPAAQIMNEEGTNFIPCVAKEDYEKLLVGQRGAPGYDNDYKKAFVSFSNQGTINSLIQLFDDLDKDENVDECSNTCAAITSSTAMARRKSELPYGGNAVKYFSDPDKLFYKDGKPSEELKRKAMRQIMLFNSASEQERGRHEAGAAVERQSNREYIEAFLDETNDDSLKSYYNLFNDKLFSGMNNDVRDNIFQKYPNLVTKKMNEDSAKNGGFIIDTNPITEKMGIDSASRLREMTAAIDAAPAGNRRNELEAKRRNNPDGRFKIDHHYPFDYINTYMMYGVIDESANFDTMLNRDTLVRKADGNIVPNSKSVNRKNMEYQGMSAADRKKFRSSIQYVYADNIQFMVDNIHASINPRPYNKDIDSNNMDPSVADKYVATYRSSGENLIEKFIGKNVFLAHMSNFRTQVLSLYERPQYGPEDFLPGGE
jgi:hypothetical protein